MATKRKRRENLRQLKAEQRGRTHLNRTVRGLSEGEKAHRKLRESSAVVKKTAAIVASFIVAAASIFGCISTAQAGSYGFSFRPDPRGASSPYAVQNPRVVQGSNHDAYYRDEMASLEQEEDANVRDFGEIAPHVFVVTSSVSRGGDPVRGITYGITLKDFGRQLNESNNSGQGTVTFRLINDNVIEFREDVKLNGRGGRLETKGYVDATSGELLCVTGSMSPFEGFPGYNIFYDRNAPPDPLMPPVRGVKMSPNAYLASFLVAKSMVPYRQALANVFSGARYAPPVRPQGGGGGGVFFGIKLGR
jgi:hypothetical protein